MKRVKVPKLRFRADDGSEFPEWEEKRLGELGEFIGGGTPPTKVKEYWKGTIPWISSSDVFENDIRQLSVSRFITEEAIEKSAAKRISENSICIVCRVGVGKVVITPFELCTSQDFVSITALKDDICFLGYAIWNLMQRKILDVRGTSIKGIPVKDLREYMIDVPSLPEQQKIASFLSTIDEIITTTQSELTAWEERKKGVMQKIFNREVRFKADDGSEFPEWEEKRLGEICDIVGGGTPDTEQAEYWSEDVNWFTPSEIGETKYVVKSNRQISKLGLLKSSAKLLPEGTILLTSRATLGEMAITKQECCTNQGFQSLIVKQECLNEFIYYCQPIIKRYCEKHASGSTFLEISKKEIAGCKLSVPSLPEQKKIADCLSSLDDVINQIQAELSAWKEFKKGLLQQMFV